MGLFDPEGLGAGTRRPLVPQEVAHLPLQSTLNSKESSPRSCFKRDFSFHIILSTILLRLANVNPRIL
ncbi:hypothetical protein ACQCVP_01000 [Rossellomorea vietnamensis]